jgi:hypothetical protein
VTKSIESGVLGVGLGGLYGLLSLGLALIHRGSTVLNGAQGSFACLWGDAGLHFRRSHMQTGLGAVVAVVTSAAFGVLTNQLGMRSTRGSSYLTKVIATLGLRIFWEDFVGWRIKGWFKEVNGFFPIRPISALDGSPNFAANINGGGHLRADPRRSSRGARTRAVIRTRFIVGTSPLGCPRGDGRGGCGGPSGRATRPSDDRHLPPGPGGRDPVSWSKEHLTRASRADIEDLAELYLGKEHNR